jgi:hypothetical protein
MEFSIFAVEYTVRSLALAVNLNVFHIFSATPNRGFVT